MPKLIVKRLSSKEICCLALLKVLIMITVNIHVACSEADRTMDMSIVQDAETLHMD